MDLIKTTFLDNWGCDPNRGATHCYLLDPENPSLTNFGAVIVMNEQGFNVFDSKDGAHGHMHYDHTAGTSEKYQALRKAGKVTPFGGGPSNEDGEIIRKS